ncbi:tetratricopeptide repeat protein [Komagataeibacter sp. FNDCR2]|uniref:tetratricopeptide repeat protein n=1 Tax=Komagataeibacter sp. FNDCR2 TaxID=2878682 RepID=UPI0038CF6284
MAVTPPARAQLPDHYGPGHHGVDQHAGPPAGGYAHAGRRDPAAPTIAELETELSHAATANGAHDLMGRIEQLRMKDLAPTTSLLLRRAQDDLDAQRPLDAVQDMDDALLLQPDMEVLWRNRAQARLAAANPDGAVADLGVALHHDGRDLTAWKILVNVEQIRGDWQAAWKAWQHVLQLDPTTPDAAHETERLRLKAFGQPT